MVKCSLCLIHEKELLPFVQEFKKKYPKVEITFEYHMGSVEISLDSKEMSIDAPLLMIKKAFPTFFFQEKTIQEAVCHSFIERGKTLSLAESCSGGVLASQLTAIPDASKFFQGSLVVYSNEWKERLLHVSRTTLEKYGSASTQVAVEMIKGLMGEFDTDFAVATTGVLGPALGDAKVSRGTVFIAIAKRGSQIDVGSIYAPLERINAMRYTAALTFGALWRRIVHNELTFS